MPRYFFDIEDGSHSTRDMHGHELAGPDAARVEAIRVLPDIARDEAPHGNNRDYKVAVRDRTGKVIFEARLALRAEWLGGFTP